MELGASRRRRARRLPFDLESMTTRFLVFAVALSLSCIGSISADDNIRTVQTRLRAGGFYFGEIDGSYSSALSAALTRYQIRNGLPVTGQLDPETSQRLGAKPAVTSRGPADRTQNSATWHQLRKSNRKSVAKSNSQTLRSNEPRQTSEKSGTERPARNESVRSDEPEGTVRVRVVPQRGNDSSAANVNTARILDYVAAFVLAGLDPRIGAEVEFFTDRVRYFNDGIKTREAIRKDLQRYNARWPTRKFWIAGDIKVEPQSDNRLRVTFPLRFELQNGSKHSSGQVQKTIVLEPLGDDDFLIAAVNERKN